ncbi:biogenesis of lysosome-related organelles complex 1 subunit 4 [Agrilus planipennis]|uniref:Biogenesis of lysosome-related organelles complex 1 subunit 4 n=1 Tax=Agrilus planipennis TaxID=224129 RepID=A0A1W4XRR7_AGRPL|nr:biogenesis of lysosome-related organelles complex 1 subunit 4 [Agrilus planipennis]
MIKKVSEDYSKYLNLKIDEKLNGVNQIVDDMLTRLEEFETLIVLVQQERCNAVGMTGHLSQTTDNFDQIKSLCSKVDLLEKMVQDADMNITALENKVSVAEEHYGLADNSNKLKNLLMPLFKKPSKPQTMSSGNELKPFTAESYFDPDKQGSV